MSSIGVSLDSGIQLQHLASGDVAEKFEHALKMVMANINDLQMPATKKRQIVITLSFDPNEDRSNAAVDISVEAKLASPRPAQTRLYLVNGGDELVVSEFNPKQPNLQFQ